MTARVLVVEDDDHIATALAYLLARDGCAQERMASGRGVVARIRDARPDLVLLDVMLPEVSGFDICAEVRADPTLGDVKILLMTARGAATERRRGEALGADGFISKPFEIKALRDEMRRVCRAIT